jgi:hypothetical protein
LSQWASLLKHKGCEVIRSIEDDDEKVAGIGRERGGRTLYQEE